jgi:hypothetical protein
VDRQLPNYLREEFREANREKTLADKLFHPFLNFVCVMVGIALGIIWCGSYQVKQLYNVTEKIASSTEQCIGLLKETTGAAIVLARNEKPTTRIVPVTKVGP